jgi:nucleoside-diphosphate-sugar epimerase
LKALVTGAGGFIGSHVVGALRNRGVPFARLTRPTDYHDAAAVEAMLHVEAPQILVHCAWHLAPGSAYLGDPANVEEADASLRLFHLARRAGVRRIVGLGTCLEYEESPGPVAEDTPLRPRTVYGESKAELFRAAEAWAADADVTFAWARLYFPYGPREAPHRLIPSVVNGLLRGERVATTPGTQRRSFLYAADVGDAIAAIALSDACGAVNVGAADVVAVRELVELIAALVGRQDLLNVGVLPHRCGDPEVLWPDVRKLSSLGWTPSRDLEGGLRETVAWWQKTLDT